MIELATGCFPYPKWNSVFEQLQQVVHGDPPRLDPSQCAAKSFSVEFVNFVNTCLIKEESQRPKYTKLLDHPFIKASEAAKDVDIVGYVVGILDKMGEEEVEMDTS